MSTRPTHFGKYQLLERINVGGMAEVYKARLAGVAGFERLVAIKRILPTIAADRDFIKMFIDEAKISVKLTHSAIAQTYELGRVDDTYFIALEYVPGRDLRALFEKLRRGGGAPPPAFVAQVIARVAEGLDYAHRKTDAHGRSLEIVHRDISPQNLIVSYEGDVKIVDFGIAKAAGKLMQTQAGILKGKFGYMSPEQVRGQPIDGRSDIFSLGTVLHELLTGQRLFVGDSDYSVLEQVRVARVTPPHQIRREVPEALSAVVLRALVREPEDRYQTAAEMATDLNRWCLSQARPLSRDDLGSYVQRMFAEDFAREKALLARMQAESAELTPTVTHPDMDASLAFETTHKRGPARRSPVAQAPEPASRPPPPLAASFDDEATRTETATSAGPLLQHNLQALPQTRAPVKTENPQAPSPPPQRPPSQRPASQPPPANNGARAASSPPSANAALFVNHETRTSRLPTGVAPAVPSAPAPSAWIDDDSTFEGQAVRSLGALRPDVTTRAELRPSAVPAAPRPPPAPAPGSWITPEQKPVLLASVAVIVAVSMAIAWVTSSRPGNETVAPALAVVEAPAPTAVAAPPVAAAPPVRPVAAPVPVPSTPVPTSAEPVPTARVVAAVPAEARPPERSGRGRPREAELGSAIDRLRQTERPQRDSEDAEVEDRAPPSPPARSRPAPPPDEEVEQDEAPRAETPRGEPGRLRVSSKPQARLWVDGRDTGEDTPVLDLVIPAGKHRLRLDAGDRVEQFEVDVPPGKSLTIIKVLKAP